MMFEKEAQTNDLLHKFLVECWSSYALQGCLVLSTALKFWIEVSFIYLEVVKMSKQIINLTSDIVAKEIENVLDTYSHHPYQQAFAIPEIRQKLIAYVLSRTRTFYTVVEDAQETSINLDSLSHSLEQRLYIEPLIRHGIQSILQENSDWINCHIPTEASPAPSRWFG